MLLTELILSKRGPLAKVWLSAHHERKLSKQQALGVDVGETVEAILDQDEGAVALRLSGQLMLGVTRIYSRKAQYLLDDCKEARENITRAFRPGNVDLPDDQQRVSKNSITLPDTHNDFDFFDLTWTVPTLPSTLANSSSAVANLRPSGASREYGAYNFGRPAANSIYGGSTPSRQMSQDGDGAGGSSYLDSNNFSGVDLGLLDDINTFGPGGSGASDTEIGRRGSTPVRYRSLSALPGMRDKSSSVGPRGLPMDDFGNIDLNLDLEVPELETRSRRESSALSTPPPVSPPAAFPNITDITPRTAAKIANLPQPGPRSSPSAPPKPKKNRLLTADDDLELDEANFMANRDNSDILGVERYIPSDPEIIRLREIASDPAGHFLPTLKSVTGDVMFYAGPLGLADELRDLFTFPSNILRRRAEDHDHPGHDGKRQRTLESEPEPELDGHSPMENARRGSSVFPGFAGGAEPGDDTLDIFPSNDNDMPGDQFGFDNLTPLKQRVPRPRSPSLAPSRAESIARQAQHGERGDHLLSLFELAPVSMPRDQEDQSQSQATPSKSVISEVVSKTSSGYSKNTGMAMGLLRREIEAIEAGQLEKAVSFDTLGGKASKHAASAFFFELLVLGTRDCIKLDQKGAFGDINIAGKEKLFEEIIA